MLRAERLRVEPEFDSVRVREGLRPVGFRKRAQPKSVKVPTINPRWGSSTISINRSAPRTYDSA